MGCAVLMHNKPQHGESYDDHAIDGLYIATSPEHYRYLKIWVKNTKSIIVSNTVLFKHQYIITTELTKADALVVAAQLLIKIL